VSATTVEVFDAAQLVAHHERAVGRRVEVLTLDHYPEELQTKPGALPGATALAQAKACGAFNHHDRWVGFNDHGEQILHQEPVTTFIKNLI
jgi:hypothetical protein